MRVFDGDKGHLILLAGSPALNVVLRECSEETTAASTHLGPLEHQPVVLVDSEVWTEALLCRIAELDLQVGAVGVDFAGVHGQGLQTNTGILG